MICANMQNFFDIFLMCQKQEHFRYWKHSKD